MRRASHESFLVYAHYRYLKWSIFVSLVSIAAYALYAPDGIRRGDTVVGWTLGLVSGVLMVWLMAFGVRKRSYRSHRAPLRSWLSGHFYLGLTLPLIAALHCAFRIGWNLHGILYGLMFLVVLTGILGSVLYRRIPASLSRDRASEKLVGLVERIAEVDADCSRLAGNLPDVFAKAVALSVDETHIGGGTLSQLRLSHPRDGTVRALASVEAHVGEASAEDREVVGELLTHLGMKRTLLGQVRQIVRSKAMLDLWLIAHVPLAFAAIAALAAHIVAVLYM